MREKKGLMMSYVNLHDVILCFQRELAKTNETHQFPELFF